MLVIGMFKRNAPKMNLTPAKSRVALIIKVPGSTLRRRTYRGRLGIYRAKPRHGKCNYCSQWDHIDEPAVTAVYAGLRVRVKALAPNFPQLGSAAQRGSSTVVAASLLSNGITNMVVCYVGVLACWGGLLARLENID